MSDKHANLLIDDDLLRLLSAHADGQLSDEEHGQLTTLLRDDPAARAAYFEFTVLRAGLWRKAGRRRAMEELVGKSVGHAPHDKSRVSDSVGHAPHDKNRVSVPARGACPTPRKSLLNWASRHPKVPSIAIAATVLIAALVVLGLTPMKQWIAGDGDKTDEQDVATPGKEDFVAKLSNWQNDVWLEGTRPPLDDPRLMIGRRLKIESGLIEVTYLTGAKVVIEGPAEFVVGGMKDEGGRMKEEGRESEGHPSSFIPHPSNTGFLHFGSLVARVEGEKAQGFTIDTPSARVEDHGTEFGVHVSMDGASDVLVVDGAVTVENPKSGHEIVLNENDGVHLSPDGMRTLDFDEGSTRYVRIQAMRKLMERRRYEIGDTWNYSEAIAQAQDNRNLRRNPAPDAKGHAVWQFIHTDGGLATYQDRDRTSPQCWWRQHGSLLTWDDQWHEQPAVKSGGWTRDDNETPYVTVNSGQLGQRQILVRNRRFGALIRWMNPAGNGVTVQIDGDFTKSADHADANVNFDFVLAIHDASEDEWRYVTCRSHRSSATTVATIENHRVRLDARDQIVWGVRAHRDFSGYYKFIDNIRLTLVSGSEEEVK